MTRVYVADAKPEERTALRLLLLDLKMEMVGEAADWLTVVAQAPTSGLDMLLIDWALLPHRLQAQSLATLRTQCPKTIVIILISYADAQQQAAISAGADIFISKNEMPERVAARLRLAAANIPPPSPK